MEGRRRNQERRRRETGREGSVCFSAAAELLWKRPPGPFFLSSRSLDARDPRLRSLAPPVSHFSLVSHPTMGLIPSHVYHHPRFLIVESPTSHPTPLLGSGRDSQAPPASMTFPITVMAAPCSHCQAESLASPLTPTSLILPSR